MSKQFNQIIFSEHLTRGNFHQALYTSYTAGIRWMPDSFNKPEDEIIKETDEKYFNALKQYCEECRAICEFVNDVAIEHLLRAAHEDLYMNDMRQAMCHILAKKAIYAIQPPILVVDVSNMDPEYIQWIKDNLSKNKMAVTPLKEFKDLNLGEHYASIK